MRIGLKLFVVILLWGCGRQKVSVPVGDTTVQVEERKLTDEQKITLLRVEAHRRGLRWDIFCDDDKQHRWKFLASAKHKSAPEYAHYIEDGAQPYWVASGNSQAEAAYDLYQLIQGPEQFKPDHRPNYESPGKPDWCPPELRGD